jgi:hypothetical protein
MVTLSPVEIWSLIMATIIPVATIHSCSSSAEPAVGVEATAATAIVIGAEETGIETEIIAITGTEEIIMAAGVVAPVMTADSTEERVGSHCHL